MKRNTMLTLVMMLSSVAAAVAAPETPDHRTMVDCVSTQQVAAIAHATSQPMDLADRAVLISASTYQQDTRQAADCGDDVTAPYRRLHHGGMKLPSGCAAST